MEKPFRALLQNLDQTFESEHFRFYYTNEGNDAISDIDYILQMADIFENVYKFYIDTLGFSPPAQDPASNDDLYEIFIENLPSFFFGITYTKNTALEAPACASFIKMRNNYLGSQFNEHTEVENIQVTAVHEFSMLFSLATIVMKGFGLWRPLQFGVRMNSTIV